jgi:D-alanine transaminase
MGNVYLNGELLPLEQARVSVLDRGFLFGDGVYEVIPAYAGRLFRLTEHLDRLENSLRSIRMEPPLSHAQWARILDRLLAGEPPTDLTVYLQITRGAASKRDHAIPKDIPPTLFAMATVNPPSRPDAYAEGVAAITLDDIRWHLCNIKAVTLLANVLQRQRAVDEDAMEAILIRDGLAHEGAASNLFIVEEGTIVTPPKGTQLLPGITRDLVLELAADAGLPHREDDISEAQLRDADEVWLTSSSKEVIPVTRLNGKPVADGRPGPLWQRMTGLYQEYKTQLRRGEF